jgi:hypothetical protein
MVVERELDAARERFIVSSTELGATHSFKLAPVGTLLPSLLFKLPTHPDSREYLSYRGSLGVDLELKNNAIFKLGQAHAFGAAAGFSAARNFYQYDANQAGGLNRLWQVALYTSLSYSLYEALTVLFKFQNGWSWFRDGAVDNQRYELTGAISYSPIRQIALSLVLLNSDRTFLYDQVSWNLKLFSPESTQLIFMCTYLPRTSQRDE